MQAVIERRIREALEPATREGWTVGQLQARTAAVLEELQKEFFPPPTVEVRTLLDLSTDRLHAQFCAAFPSPAKVPDVE